VSQRTALSNSTAKAADGAWLPAGRLAEEFVADVRHDCPVAVIALAHRGPGGWEARNDTWLTRARY